MSIRYSRELNREMSRVVHNFNQNRNRAIKRGLKNIPPLVRVSDLKARYTSRSELNKELDRLSQFKGDDALKTVETQGGATAVKWEFDHLKAITNEAKKFYDREILSTRRYLAKFPRTRDIGKEERLNELLDKRAFLDLNIMNLNQLDFITYRKTIEGYTESPKYNRRSYRGFLSEVEFVMGNVGIDTETINKFMNNFKVLTPEEFIYLYNNSDLISRIYDLADSPTLGGIKLNTSVEDAEELINNLLQEQDSLIKQAQDEFKSLNALTNRQR